MRGRQLATARRLATARYHEAIGRARALAGSRALGDGPTAGELLLEGQWERALKPRLADLYRRPIAARLPAMWEMDAAEIAGAVLAFYGERPEALAGLRAVARRYARRGFDLGGQMGLDELGLDGQFALSDEEIIDQVLAQVDELMRVDGGAELSLVATTAGEIGRELTRRRDEGVELADLMPLLSAWILGRTVIRSAMIAATESVRMSRWGMTSVFAGNGIRGVVHECEANVMDRCTSGTCPPLCGTEYVLGGVLNPMSGISRAGWIPLHSRCRCWYSPLRDGWVKPALIWTGFAVGLLD